MTAQFSVTSAVPRSHSSRSLDNPAFHHLVAKLAIALSGAIAGILLSQLVFALIGHFMTALLVLPVVAATWYGGAISGAVTIVAQGLAVASLLDPAYSLRISSSDDFERLTVSIIVSTIAVWMVARARKTERYFRTVVDIALDGIWVVDAAGRTTFVNPRMADMLGYTRAEMRHRPFTEFVAESNAASIDAAFQAIRHGHQQWSDVQLRRRDGSPLWAYYAATPIYDGAAFKGAMAVVTDISQRKRDEETIRRQSAELQRADLQKDQFLAMVGHEMRNPLMPILTAVRVMEMKGDLGFQQERAIIARQATLLSRLVDDLSDVSRFMRGKVTMLKQTVDLAQVIEQARETAEPLLARKGHALEVHVPEGLTVEGDAARLDQVVVNLLTNAAKYTQPGGRIVIAGERSGETVTVRVQDSGIGIHEDFLPFVFEPFSQKPQARGLSEGGLGLGLAIVRDIVRAHRGTIECRSEGEGQGSEFVVRLPVTADATVTTSPSPPEPLATSAP